MKPHIPIAGATRERAPICLSRRTALLLVAVLLAGGCTLSTWLNLLLTSTP